MAPHIIDVLYEDNHLLAVNKPAGLPTMGVAEDRPSLAVLVRQFIKAKYGKPGNVFLGIVSRLDAPVTGVVIMARTSKAAARLSRQFRERRVEKTYWALVEGIIAPPAGRLEHFLRKDKRHRKVYATLQGTADAQHAQLTYDTIRTGGGFTWLRVQPITGRKHQIRVQLSKAGFPICGDRKYGGTQSFPQGIALHARSLRLEHPTLKTPVEIVAPPPRGWEERIGAP